ncbi:hypothetical protein ACFPYI_00090 [Halomarina salina]|uniref:Uncharacterized protein n=1 Tax=Halomarina salina TaxID=1872699 RepID=A0ABD5RHB4_9EURY
MATGVVIAVFSVALAIRALSLYQSPLPFIVDGVEYAGQATDTVVTSSFPLEDLTTDEIAFT